MADQLLLQAHIDLATLQSDLKKAQALAGKTKINIGAKAGNKQLGEMDKNLGSILKKVAEIPLKFGLWYAVSGIVTGFFSSIRNGVETLFEFDKALTNISFTMDITNSELTDMMDNALKTANALTTTASEVLVANQIFTNLSESIESVNQKTETTIALANITGNSVTKTADAIQGLAFQFDIASDKTAGLSDVMASIARETGVEFNRSILGMTEAVSRSGSVASEAGFNYNEFLATIATVQEQSRLTGGSIASGLVTILSRASRVSDASAKDISKVETALKKVSVQLRDSTTGEFRDMFDVLVDLSKVYPDLTSIQQSEIGFLLAGTRQRKVFNNIMANMDTIVQRSTDSLENQGLTMELNDIYAESLAGHTTDFKNSLEELWVSMGDNETFKALIDSSTAFIDLLTGFDKNVGIVNTAIRNLTIGFAPLFNTLDHFFGILNPITEEVDSLALSQKKLSEQSNLKIWNETIGALEGYDIVLNEATDSLDDLIDNTISATEAYNDYKWSIAPVNEEKKKVIATNKELTESEQELATIMQLPIDQLEKNAEIYPLATEAMIDSEINLTKGVIEETEARIIAREQELKSIQTLAGAQLDALRLSGAPESFIRQQEDSVLGLSGNLAMDLKQLGELRERLSGLTSVQDKYFSTAKKSKKETINLMDAYSKLFDTLEDIQHQSTITSEELNRATGEERIPIIEKQIDLYEQQQDALHNIAQAMRETRKEYSESSDEYRELTEAIQDQGEGWSSLESSIFDANKSIDDIRQGIQDLADKELEKLKEQLEDNAEIISEKLNKALEDEIDLLNDAKDSASEKWDLLIDKAQDAIDAQKNVNDELADEKALQEGILAVEKARQFLTNVQAEQDVLKFTGEGATGFQLVADPREVLSAQESLAQSEKSLEDLRVQQKQDAEISKLESKKAELEAEKEAELEFYDTQIENLQNQQELLQENIKAGNEIQQELLNEIISIVEASELDSYGSRLMNLQEFVDDYNSKLAQINSLPSIGGTDDTFKIMSTTGEVITVPKLTESEARKMFEAEKAGSKAVGGKVNAGSLYEVNELGTEGLLTSVGGKDFLTPLSNGNIMTASAMSNLNTMPNITPNSPQGISIGELKLDMSGVKNANDFAKQLPQALQIEGIKLINRTRS